MKIVLKYLGYLLILFSIFPILPVITAIIYGESFLPFFAPSVLALILGIALL